jgi:hypothetical protein
MRFIDHLPIGRRVAVKHHRPTDGYAFTKSLAWAHHRRHDCVALGGAAGDAALERLDDEFEGLLDCRRGWSVRHTLNIILCKIASSPTSACSYTAAVS